MVKEITKIKKIQVIYDEKEATAIVDALLDTFRIIKKYEPELNAPEILEELIEDLTWNEVKQ